MTDEADTLAGLFIASALVWKTEAHENSLRYMNDMSLQPKISTPICGKSRNIQK
ncbi:hypothetical protein Agau_P200326 (plasmid) [Agrobacterium tumefaciens F2]|nr:hypothetical protein Agau_P200326 [Agrobacterium tumefaciens F2]